MSDRPILFSGPMVRALLDGRKTQTRRLFKPRGFEFYTHPVSGDRYNEYRPYRDGTWDESRISGSGTMFPHGWGEHLYGYFPYAPGDRLWVKETWACHWATDDQKPSEITDDLWSVRYIADDYVRPAARDGSAATPDQFKKKRVAIFMPRWASRITLTVTDVRVERLNDCSEADAIAEGVAEYACEGDWRGPNKTFWTAQCGADISRLTPVAAYHALWDSINGEGAWEANPWIVAVTFTVDRRNIDEMAG